jgi:protein-S-isoprenylcysteine O-methyltransferase Ste14
MSELSARILLAILLVSFVVHRGIQTRRAAPKAGNIAKTLQLGDSEKLANLLSLVALLSSLLFILAPSWVAFAAFSAPSWLRWLGVVIALAGFGMMQWAQTSLGKNWSDTPVQLRGHSLTTNGPYRWIRHPIYTAFLTILTAPLFITANWLVGLSWILGTFIDINARIAAEEGMLRETFADFASYEAKTGRLLPRLGR